MFSVFDDIPEIVNFFWDPPSPVQRNGIITGYNIVCIPTEGGQPVSITVTDVGMSGTLSATVGMFTPATQYSCAITASTSAGPGPAETRIVITCKETILPFTYIINQLCVWLYCTEFPQSNQQLTYLHWEIIFCKFLVNKNVNIALYASGSI